MKWMLSRWDEEIQAGMKHVWHFEFDFTLGKNKPDAWISSMDGSLLQLTNYEQPSTWKRTFFCVCVLLSWFDDGWCCLHRLAVSCHSPHVEQNCHVLGTPHVCWRSCCLQHGDACHVIVAHAVQSQTCICPSWLSWILGMLRLSFWLRCRSCMPRWQWLWSSCRWWKPRCGSTSGWTRQRLPPPHQNGVLVQKQSGMRIRSGEGWIVKKLWFWMPAPHL